MSEPMPDPFESLAVPTERQEPRPSFARQLRARLVDELGVEDSAPPSVQLPERKRIMTATQAAETQPTTRPPATAVTPYLTVHDGAGAIDWYTEAFGAVEQFRVVGDDGKLGHAEFTIGAARFMLSDEYLDIGVKSPTTLGGPGVGLHLAITDVDAQFHRAVAAGATSLQEPADQPHGARHGTLSDPYGHRWMLSQQLEDLDLETYADRSEGSGFSVVSPRRGGDGNIWAAMFYRDAPAGIQFMTEVLGFEEQLVVTHPDDETNVVHSQIRWPEGGIVQAGTYDPDNPFSRPPGDGGLYVITSDPLAVWERCQAAGVEVVRAPESPDYDPSGMGFSVRDPEGNIWSFGSYAGEA